MFFRIDEPEVERRVCAKKCTTGVSRGNLGILSFASSQGEVREVLPTASDAPGSHFGELVNLTRDSGHHWYLAHELLLSP